MRYHSLDALDAQGVEVENELRQQCAADTLVRVAGRHADGVDDRHRLGPAEVAEVCARHDESHHVAVPARGERYAHA